LTQLLKCLHNNYATAGQSLSALHATTAKIALVHL